MKHVSGWICSVVAVLCCLTAQAQSAYVLTDGNTSGDVTFTNSLGTAALDGTMIVFEGQLDADITVDAVAGTNGYLLASLQLLTQIKLFDELPASNEVGTAQGAVAALRSAPESTTGTFYVWGSTNTVSPVMEWVPLYQSNGVTPFAVTDGSTNYITFVSLASHRIGRQHRPLDWHLLCGGGRKVSTPKIREKSVGFGGDCL